MKRIIPLLAFSFLASVAALAQDAAKADPQHYKVEFENDKVRVLRVKAGPREKTAMHSHPDAVAIAITNSKLRHSFPDGKTQDADLKAGAALWTPAVSHVGENLTDKPMEVLLVELKSPAAVAEGASPVASAQAQPKMTDEQALIALDKQWTAAELRLNDDDRKTIDRTVAADYWGTTPFGQIENKAQYMAGLKSTTDTDTADEHAVRFYDGGKMAIMTHRGTVNGKPTYRSTHVWVKKGNDWQLVQNHVSNIGEPPATP